MCVCVWGGGGEAGGRGRAGNDTLEIKKTNLFCHSQFSRFISIERSTTVIN